MDNQAFNRDRKSNVLWYWLLYFTGLCILGAITFEGTLQLSYDIHDRDYMTDSAAIGIGNMFSAEKIMPGRPFFELLLWLQYQLWQDNIQLFHLTGIVLHVLASGFLALILNQRNTALPVCFTAGFLFLLNTAQFRAIHWVSAHCYPLSLLCGFAAMYCFYRWLQSDHWRFAILTYVATIAGVFSHISTVVILPVLLLDTRLCNQQTKRPIWFISFLSISALLCIFFIKNHYTLASQVSALADKWAFYEQLVQFVYLLGRLISTLHWLPFALYEPHSWDYALGAAGICAALILVIRYPSQINLYGLLWLFGGLVPFLVISFDHLITISAGPSRYLYMAGVGAAILLAHGIHSISLSAQAHSYTGQKTKQKIITHAAIVLTVTFSSIFYHAQSEVVSLYISARNDLANGYTNTGISQFVEVRKKNSKLVDLRDTYERLFVPLLKIDLDLARSIATEGLKRYPESGTLTLGDKIIQSTITTGMEQEEIIKAISELAKHNAGNNVLTVFYTNIAHLKKEDGDLPAAAKAAELLLRVDPKNPTGLWNSALVHLDMRAYRTVRERLETMLGLSLSEGLSLQREVKGLELLARLCVVQKDFASARIHTDRLRSIDPSNNAARALQKTLDQNTQPKQ